MEDYDFIEFRKSRHKGKKYAAILRNKKTNRLKTVNFGDLEYDHYQDKTNLKLYSDMDHGDEKRRDSFRARFGRMAKKKYSPAYFAYNFLW